MGELDFNLDDDPLALLNALLAENAVPTNPGIPLRLKSPATAASFAQRGLWFLNQLDPANAAYHVPLIFSIEGELKTDVLAKALEALVRLNEPLRTVFRLEGSELQQVVLPAFSPELARTDLSGLTKEGAAASFQALASRLGAETFDLARGPLVRANFVQIEPGKQALLLNIHHAVIDAWSGDLLFAQLMELYRRLEAGQALPEMALLQYADYAEWQSTEDKDGRYEASLGYWKAKLDGVTPLVLPTDRPRAGARSSKGEKVRFTLPADIVQKLNELCQREGTTLFVGLVTLFKILLHRQTEQTDIVIGSGSASRGTPELLDMVGLFLNNLVLRTDFSGDPTFPQALERVRSVVVDGLSHQEVPFEKILGAVVTERTSDPNPLFQVVFTFNEKSVQEVRLPSALVTLADPNLVEVGSAKHDLSVHCWTTGGAVEGVFEFSLDLFDRVTIEAMTAQFERIARQAVDGSALPVSRYELLDPAEREKILVEWNRTERAVSGETFLDGFLRFARTQPELVAAVCCHESLTYGELHAKSDRLAGELVRLGLTRESPVAVCQGRTTDLLVSFLGVLKAGGAYLPLDAGQPAQRLKAMVEVAKPHVVLCDAGTRALAEQLGVPVLSPSEPSQGLTELPPPPTPGQLAYVLFTSGSTGTPKGVMVEHRSLGHLADWARAQYDLKPGDRCALLTNLGFDPTLEELAAYLSSGVTLYLGGDHLRISPDEMRQWLIDMGITICQLPAPILETIVDKEFPASFPLRLFLTGGERLRKRPHLSSQFEVVNRYGPTECTVYCTEQRLTRVGDRPFSIGRPIANTKVYVLNAHRQPVPAGVKGEIYVSGLSLARGYWNEPGKTADAFVPDPFTPDGRLYRTGDLGRFTKDGVLEFLGRADGQVKIRGMRIEIGEIETALKAFPGVKDVLVLAQKQASGDSALVAYVISDEAQENSWRTWLRARLPEPMVPGRYVSLKIFPLTANGKVDVRKLPAPKEVTEVRAVSTAAPASGTAATIAQIWGEVLGGTNFGTDQNFFDLGGHSLLLAQVQNKLGKALQRPVKLTDLIKYPTISALAEALGGATPGTIRKEQAVLSDARLRAERRAKLLGLGARGK